MSRAVIDDNHQKSLLAKNKISASAEALTSRTLGTTEALDISIVDGSGNHVTSFGGGTQYTEGDVDASLTGTIAMAEGPVNTATPLLVDGSQHLQVDIAADSVGIGGGTQYTEGDVDASITGTALMMEDGSNTLRAATGNVANGLDVDVTRVQGTVTVGGTVGIMGVDGTTIATNANPVPMSDAGGSITVDGTVNAAQSGSWSVTATQGTATNLKTQAESYQGGTAVGSGNPLQVTLANTGANATAVKVDGSAVTQPVSGTVGVSGTVTVDSELTTDDLDTGAGTDTRAVVGIVGSKSGGAALIPGDATAGLKVDLGADNDVTVTSGTITSITNVVHVDDNGSTVSIDDGGGSVTVDNAALSVTGGGVEASALRVTLASDSTGVLSVDDNGGSITVDNGGTFAVQESGSALTALQLIDDPVFADDAAYTLSTSKGNVVSGVAVQTDGTDPSAVSAEGDAAALRTDMNRILLVNTTPPRLTSNSENNATAQTNNPILSAPGANLSLYITDIIVSNGATAGSIKFVEDTGGTPVVKVQETYMAINGGAVMNFTTPIRVTANKDFGYTSTTVTTHSVTVNGYIAP